MDYLNDELFQVTRLAEDEARKTIRWKTHEVGKYLFIKEVPHSGVQFSHHIDEISPCWTGSQAIWPALRWTHSFPTRPTVVAAGRMPPLRPRHNLSPPTLGVFPDL